MRLNRLLYALLLVITMQSFSLAQEREVSGSVKDASGEPLFGAAVMVEGGGKSQLRSEERRVGKECRSRWSPYH